VLRRPTPLPVRRSQAAGLTAALLLAVLAAALGAPGAALALRKASHKGWPAITGVLLINKFDQSRPLDARAGQDPFQGTDRTYRCDGDHRYQGCFVQAQACLASLLHANLCAVPPVMSDAPSLHNELLGGHGNDTIHAGDNGDVIWGDYKPSGQPATQTDRLYGGRGDDFIYTSHGMNLVHTGGGTDVVHAHYGHGEIYCDSPSTVVYLSHRSSRVYHLHGCGRTTFKPAGTQAA
jgi:hypothetical protein